MPAEDYDPDELVTVTVQLYVRQYGLLAAEKGRSRYVRDAFGLLEDGSLDPYTRAGEPPGVALRRAVDDAKRAGELRRTLKLVYVLATSGVGPEDDRWGRVVQEAERVLFPDDAPGEGDGDD